MKLRTKLTLWFGGLLLLVYVALLLALHMIAGRAAENTARTTLESVVTSYAGEIDYEHGRLRSFKTRTYVEGAYLQVYSADGGELMAGTDIFGISSRMPGFLWDNAAETVFHIDTEEAGVYCYILWLPEESDSRGHSGKTSASEGWSASGEPDSAAAEDDGVWVVGLLPEDSMENVTGSVLRYAGFGLPSPPQSSRQAYDECAW